MAPMRAIRTRYGARLVHGRAYLSKILRAPGPTHEVFDVLAAAVTVVAPPGRMALLGFAGGGIVAPLRALGDHRAVRAVDLDTSAEPLFRSLSRSWCGHVSVTPGDAASWLERTRGPFAVVLDDLSINERGDVTKPALSYESLPGLARAALAPGGVAVVNALPVPGCGWERLVPRLAGDAPRVVEVRVVGYDNRIVLAGDDLGGARSVGTPLRAALGALGSGMAPRIRVRTVR